MKPQKNKLWRAADRRAIRVEDLGDRHLVNILYMIESNRAGVPTRSGTLPPGHMLQYGDLVIEAIRRGLFNWSNERKYLTATENDIKERYVEKT